MSGPAYGQVITLTSVPTGPVLVNGITVAPSTPQTIVNIYYSGNTLQVTFSSSAPVIITIQSSAQPVSVYADSTQLTEVTSTSGLTVSSNAWIYQNQAVTVYADPSSITLFYQTPSAATPQSPTSSGMSTIGIAAVIGIIAIIGIAAIAIMGRRRKKP